MGGSVKWRFVGVYGDPHRSNNSRIWAQIEVFLEQYDFPTILLGDFNAIVSESEKWGGCTSLSPANRAFKNWVNEAGLIDLGFSEPAYTWTDKQTRLPCKHLTTVGPWFSKPELDHVISSISNF